ncbi:hypothetical protein Z051_08210 [Rhodococcus rhodochrous KG-21]|uniref:AMP-dependent synthetase n=1 Tax=Rhodococcus rhodochrous KG-21 TaxID=1441923 RepID=A0A0N0S0Z5_RHORH|nr:hypothetical protein Z051_08210 [Rhodococcus rhodochrous KG-21]
MDLDAAYVDRRPGADVWNCSIGEALRRTASIHGQHRALAWHDQGALHALTWDELEAEAERAARGILSIISAGQRIAIIGGNSRDWVVAEFACALAGTPLVPIEPTATNHECRHMLTQTDTRLVLSADEYRGASVLRRMRRLAAGSMNDAVHVLRLGEWPTVETLTDLPDVRASDEFLVQHTSGTTGKPKGAVLSHYAALNSARMYAHATQPVENEVWLNPLPLSHVGGSVAGVLSALNTAGTYCVLPRFTPQSALDMIRDAGVTVLGLVPTMLLDLLNLPSASRRDFVHVRIQIGGATAIDPALIERVEKEFDLRFLVGYGQSEAPCLTMSTLADSAEIRATTTGHPLPGREVSVKDVAGNFVSWGTPGELCVRSEMSMTGYLTATGKIAPAVDGHGWLHTGDLCSMSEDGIVQFHSRLREVIIRGGLNIYPAEVEQVLNEHPDVVETAVFGVPDVRLGHQLGVALIVRSPISIEALERFAAKKLSMMKVPTYWHLVDEFPRTSTGKIRKIAVYEHLYPN